METYLNYEKLSNDLKTLIENQNENYYDFEIICDFNSNENSIQNSNQNSNENSFKTHKSILSSRSHYFKSLFRSKMKEFQQNKIILKDVSSQILSSILNYFYSGKIEVNLENVIEILIFSSKYLIDELIEFCLNFIKKNCQLEIVVDLLKLSDSRNLKELLDFCYQFILERFDEFLNSPFFIQLEENHLISILSNDEISTNEFEIFHKITKWGKNRLNINQEKRIIDNQEKEQFKNLISNVIDKIRFIDFSKEELDHVLKEDLIPNQISEKLTEFQKLEQNDEKELEEFIENQNSFIFKQRFRFRSSIIQEKQQVNQLKEWINDDKNFARMKKGFSAKQDGFSGEDFHNKCDNKGRTLIIIKTSNDSIFGAYTKVGFISGNERFIEDPNAFIFSFKNPNNDPPQKFSIKEGEEAFALYHRPGFGPYFGKGYDICFNYNLQPKMFNFGLSYNLPNGISYASDEARSFIAGFFGTWRVEEFECHFI
ncbi:pep-cterm sorting domain-containing protein [Anaeramoeba ignava]|uniref:Pep-cterm sorting domain-containing protein n=1 Tax=Anaeramoeba ignava TaxID=1746090 RepID=A0A9Q0LUI0_ANAIG|nr:pep-cterm sorting domain-containing protein [Anaeramoeba ignava]